MATIKSESKSNGILTIETNSQKFYLSSTDHGSFDMEIFLTAKNDKLTTTYEFDITLISHSTDIRTSLGQKLVLFDADKKHCILTQSLRYQSPCTCYVSDGIYTYTRKWKYKIDEENIAKLNELKQLSSMKMRLETDASYVEFYLADVTNVCKYMKENIEIAQKAILKSSDDILNF